MKKKQFLGFIISGGLQGDEGGNSIVEPAFCYGNNMRQLIKDYCNKTNRNMNSKFFRKNKDNKYGYSDFGFPIAFIPVKEKFDLNEPFPEYITIKNSVRNPFV